MRKTDFRRQAQSGRRAELRAGIEGWRGVVFSAWYLVLSVLFSLLPGFLFCGDEDSISEGKNEGPRTEYQVPGTPLGSWPTQLIVVPGSRQNAIPLI